MGNEFRIKNGAISPNMVITDTDVSTSTTTGALQVAGGAGIVGNVYASAFYGAATGLTSIPGANVSGAVPSATSAGTVTTNAQPNITSVGTLTSLTSSGQIQITASNGKITLATTNGGDLRLGLEDGNVSTPMISFKTGNGTNTTVRLIASGANVAYGRGNLEILSANTTFTSGNVYASAFYGSSTTGYASIIGNTSALTLGRIDNTSSSPQFDFNSGATTVDYDARFGCTGGNGAIGYGNVYLVCNSFDIGGKFGYRTGTGSSVTQLTSRTTGVTVNALSGRITLVSATTTAGQVSTFTVTNSFMASADTVYFTQVSGTGHYIITTKSTATGSFSVNVYTPTAVSSAEAPAFNFAIIRGTLS